MLYTARQARIANRYAPKQERRVTTEAWVFGRYGPSMRVWMDAYRSPFPAGSTVSTTTDSSGRNATITQTTVAKQPISAVVQEVRCMTFDGVNDCLLTSTLVLNGTQGVTIVTVSINPTFTAGILAEAGTNAALVTDAIVNSRSDSYSRNITNFYVGNVGQQYQRGTTDYGNVWVIFNCLANKALPAASEVQIYGNNVAPPIGGAVTSENTNTFGDYAWNLGSRNNGAAGPLLGSISQVLVMNRTVSSDENIDLYRSMAQIIGVAWT